MSGTPAGGAKQRRKEPTYWHPELHTVGNHTYLRAWRRLPNGKRERVYLHKLIAEAKLGRLLLPGEVVHHKNGDTLRNTFENIDVMTRSEHATEHNFGNVGRLHPNNPRRPHADKI